MKLTSTAMKYEHVGDDGYSFTVTATQDPVAGWSARVTMAAFGYASPAASIKHLRHAATAFLKALEEMK